MKRSELSGPGVEPGLYIVDGELGDDDGYVLSGPWPQRTAADRVRVTLEAERIRKFTKRTVVVTSVVEAAPGIG